MRKGLSLIFLSVALLLFCCRDGSADVKEDIRIFQMTFKSENVSGRILINGFVVAEMEGKGGKGSVPLNSWLVGENELKAEVRKADHTKPAQLVVGVSELPKGAVVATTDSGGLFSIVLKDKDFRANCMAITTRRFKSALNFRAHLSEAGPAGLSDILIYAKKLHGLFTMKDADGILRESEVKIGDHSRAFGGTDVKGDMRSYLTHELFKSKLDRLKPAGLRAEAVGPTGNIWQIFNGRDELIKARSRDGSIIAMPVYIGLLDGKLKVVR